jgi:hypothetical protein
VVGSAIVSLVADATARGLGSVAIADEVVEFCATLAKSVHAVRREAVVE